MAWYKEQQQIFTINTLYGENLIKIDLPIISLDQQSN